MNGEWYDPFAQSSIMTSIIQWRIIISVLLIINNGSSEKPKIIHEQKSKIEPWDSQLPAILKNHLEDLGHKKHTIKNEINAPKYM